VAQRGRTRFGGGDDGQLAPEMRFVVAMTAHTGRDLAEVGFLLVALSGLWIAAAQLPQLRMPVARTALAGIALAAAGVLLIVATHWGHFG